MVHSGLAHRDVGQTGRLFCQARNVPEVITEASNDYVDDSNPVLGFIIEKYDITNNEKDNISSSLLFNEFSSYSRDSKISSKRFKDDMLGISGILCKRTKTGVVFTGLKKKEDANSDDE